MTKQELRKLSRMDLVEMLLEITQENEQLRGSLEEARKQLEERAISVEDAGNLADAALLVSDILESAQTAADAYLENIRQRDEQHRRFCLRIEQNALKKCRRIKQEAQAQVDAYLEQINMHLRTVSESYAWNETAPEEQDTP